MVRKRGKGKISRLGTASQIARHPGTGRAFAGQFKKKGETPEQSAQRLADFKSGKQQRKVLGGAKFSKKVGENLARPGEKILGTKEREAVKKKRIAENLAAKQGEEAGITPEQTEFEQTKEFVGGLGTALKERFNKIVTTGAAGKLTDLLGLPARGDTPQGREAAAEAISTTGEEAFGEIKGIAQEGLAAFVGARVIGAANAKVIRGVSTAGITAVVGADVLTDWYAADNIIGGQKFHLKEIQKDFNSGLLSGEEAIALADEAQAAVDLAKQKLTISTQVNPIMWPFRNIILTGADADQAAIDLIRLEIDQYALRAQLPEEFQEFDFPEEGDKDFNDEN